MPSPVFAPITLPCGAVLPNRLVKAAMEENLAEPGQVPGRHMFTLYRRWSEGGVGLIITGNVMVHAEALTSPGAPVLDSLAPLEPFKEWARAAHAGGATVWMQISHPGRQVMTEMGGVAWAPSAVPLDLSLKVTRFPQPTAMTPEQIRTTVARFATTARRAEEAGFDGVEVHAAHGYLLSQFMSPLVNRRTDEWGGSLENRARMLLDVVRAIRAVVQPGFAVAVKLNSADFQRGGFEVDDARRVIDMLAPLGVDVVELSGGNYESPAMSGLPADERTQAREAYFLSLAEELVATSPIPLMTTGGITRLPVAEKVLASGVSLVGMGSALALVPDLPAVWKRDPSYAVQVPRIPVKLKPLASFLALVWVRYQLRRIGSGRAPQPTAHPLWTTLHDFFPQRRALRHYRKWLALRSPGDDVEGNNQR